MKAFERDSFSIFFQGQELAYRAARAGTLWNAGRKYAWGSFIKPLNSPTRYPEYEACLALIKGELARLPTQTPLSVLDVGSPKLFSLLLLRDARVRLSSIDVWDVPIHEANALAGGLSKEARARLKLAVANLLEPLPDTAGAPHGGFDLSFALSVIEHVEPHPGGDELALRRMAELTRPGGSVVVSVPVDSAARDEYVDSPVYGKGRNGEASRVFFQRIYNRERLAALVRAVQPSLTLEAATRIEWPEKRWFKTFWNIRRTWVKGLCGPLFPFTRPSFAVSNHDDLPTIRRAGDIVLRFRRR